MKPSGKLIKCNKTSYCEISENLDIPRQLVIFFGNFLCLLPLENYRNSNQIIRRVRAPLFQNMAHFYDILTWFCSLGVKKYFFLLQIV